MDAVDSKVSTGQVLAIHLLQAVLCIVEIVMKLFKLMFQIHMFMYRNLYII